MTLLVLKAPNKKSAVTKAAGIGIDADDNSVSTDVISIELSDLECRDLKDRKREPEDAVRAVKREFESVAGTTIYQCHHR